MKNFNAYYLNMNVQKKPINHKDRYHYLLLYSMILFCLLEGTCQDTILYFIILPHPYTVVQD